MIVQNMTAVRAANVFQWLPSNIKFFKYSKNRICILISLIATKGGNSLGGVYPFLTVILLFKDVDRHR